MNAITTVFSKWSTMRFIMLMLVICMQFKVEASVEKKNFIEEKKFIPGKYVTTVKKTAITQPFSISIDDDQQELVLEGTELNIVKVVINEVERRVRGQLSDGRWVSIMDLDNGLVWLKIKDQELANETHTEATTESHQRKRKEKKFEQIPDFRDGEKVRAVTRIDVDTGRVIIEKDTELLVRYAYSDGQGRKMVEVLYNDRYGCTVSADKIEKVNHDHDHDQALKSTEFPLFTAGNSQKNVEDASLLLRNPFPLFPGSAKIPSDEVIENMKLEFSAYLYQFEYTKVTEFRPASKLDTVANIVQLRKILADIEYCYEKKQIQLQLKRLSSIISRIVGMIYDCKLAYEKEHNFIFDLAAIIANMVHLHYSSSGYYIWCYNNVLDRFENYSQRCNWDDPAKVKLQKKEKLIYYLKKLFHDKVRTVTNSGNKQQHPLFGILFINYVLQNINTYNVGDDEFLQKQFWTLREGFKDYIGITMDFYSAAQMHPEIITKLTTMTTLECIHDTSTIPNSFSMDNIKRKRKENHSIEENDKNTK